MSSGIRHRGPILFGAGKLNELGKLVKERKRVFGARQFVGRNSACEDIVSASSIPF
jgi:hypothetical protein